MSKRTSLQRRVPEENSFSTISASAKRRLITASTMPKSQRDNYRFMSWEQQVVVVRLRTGHNILNSHMHRRLKLAPSPTCPCGQEDQTTEHVLQRRPIHKAKREDVWAVDPLEDKTRMQAGAGEDDFIHLSSGPDSVACERQEVMTLEYGRTHTDQNQQN